MAAKKNDLRTEEREPVNAEVKFFVVNDLLDAQALDLSAGGIRFQTQQPIRIRLRMTVDGETREQEAELVWAERQDGDSVSYGFEFALPEDDPA